MTEKNNSPNTSMFDKSLINESLDDVKSIIKSKNLMKYSPVIYNVFTFINILNHDDIRIIHEDIENEMNAIIKECESFLDDVKKSNEKLYNEEKEETTIEVIGKTNFSIANPIIEKIYLNYIRAIRERYEKIVYHLTEEINNLQDVMKNTGTILLNNGNLSLAEIRKNINNLGDKIRNIEKYLNYLEKRDVIWKHVGDIKNKPKILENILIFTLETTCYPRIFGNLFLLDPKDPHYKEILLDSLFKTIQNLDTIHLNISKYICRLYHILEKGNRDYKNKKGCPYNIKNTYKIRDRLKSFFEVGTAFHEKYPELAKFCHELLDKLSKRNDAAHYTIPSNTIQITTENGHKVIKYPRVGKSDGCLDIIIYIEIILKYFYFLGQLPPPKGGGLQLVSASIRH